MVSTFDQNGEEYLQVDKSAMFCMLVNAVQKQQENNLKLKAESQALKNQVVNAQCAYKEIQAELNEVKALLAKLVSTSKNMDQ